MGNKWAEFSNPQVGADQTLRHKLYQLGEWEHGFFGKFEITPELHAEIVRNFEPQNLNYNHIGDDISAGLIISIEAETDDNGWAWGTSLLTDRAAEFVTKREYRGFSAEIDFKAKDRKGKPVGAYLCGGALTNTPFFPISFSDRRLAASAYPIQDDIQAATAAETGERMDPLNSRFDAETQTLFVILPDGSEAPVTLPEGFMPDMEMKKKEDEAMTAAQVAASRQINEMNSRLVALERDNTRLQTQLKDEAQRRQQAEMQSFLTLHRVAPTLQEEVKEYYLMKGPDATRVFLGKLGPVAVVDVQEYGHASEPPMSATANAFQFIEAEIAKLKKENPTMKTSQIHLSVARAYPDKFQQWECGGAK